MTLKKSFARSHEQVPKGPKVGAIVEFLSENVGGNMFYLDCEVLLLVFADKFFPDIEMIETFLHCFFGPFAACTVVAVDNGG